MQFPDLLQAPEGVTQIPPLLLASENSIVGDFSDLSKIWRLLELVANTLSIISTFEIFISPAKTKCDEDKENKAAKSKTKKRIAIIPFFLFGDTVVHFRFKYLNFQKFRQLNGKRAKLLLRYKI